MFKAGIRDATFIQYAKCLKKNIHTVVTETARISADITLIFILYSMVHIMG